MFYIDEDKLRARDNQIMSDRLAFYQNMFVQVRDGED